MANKSTPFFCYVNMRDSFLSGWGEANGKKSYLSVQCAKEAQAHAIEMAAMNRPEMRNVVRSANPSKKRRDKIVHIVSFEELGGSWRKYYSPNLYGESS